RCALCTGPLRLTGQATPPACGWCGTEAAQWACPVCAHRGLRAPVLGDARTAEELGRTFPGVRVLTSSGERVLTTVPAGPAISGDPGALDDALTLLAVPPSAEVLGPVPVGEDQWRAVVRVPRAEGPALSGALLELQRLRSARKLDPVRVEVDPPSL